MRVAGRDNTGDALGVLKSADASRGPAAILQNTLSLAACKARKVSPWLAHRRFQGIGLRSSEVLRLAALGDSPSAEESSGAAAKEDEVAAKGRFRSGREILKWARRSVRPSGGFGRDSVVPRKRLCPTRECAGRGQGGARLVTSRIWFDWRIGQPGYGLRYHG